MVAPDPAIWHSSGRVGQPISRKPLQRASSGPCGGFPIPSKRMPSLAPLDGPCPRTEVVVEDGVAIGVGDRPSGVAAHLVVEVVLPLESVTDRPVVRPI